MAKSLYAQVSYEQRGGTTRSTIERQSGRVQQLISLNQTYRDTISESNCRHVCSLRRSVSGLERDMLDFRLLYSDIIILRQLILDVCWAASAPRESQQLVNNSQSIERVTFDELVGDTLSVLSIQLEDIGETKVRVWAIRPTFPFPVRITENNYSERVNILGKTRTERSVITGSANH